MATGGVVLALGIAAPAAQAGTIDQDTTDFFGASAERITGGESVAQTFTAGRSGLLDRVDLALFIAPGLITRPLTVQIRDVDAADAPGPTVLASASITPDSIPHEDWTPVSFSARAPVTAGTRYAIVAYMPYPGFAAFPDPPFREQWLWESPTLQYAGGETFLTQTSPPEGWERLSGDRAFRTYLAPPEADLSAAIAGPAATPKRTYVTYLISARNRGPSAAQNVVLTYGLPAGVDFLSMTASQGVCAPPAKRATSLICALGDIEPGAGASAAVSLKVERPPLDSRATLTSDTSDPDTANSSATLRTQLTK